MAQVMERSPHTMPLNEGHARDDPSAPRTVVPILTTTPTIQMSGPPESDQMDIATPTNSSAPASATKSPDRDNSTPTNGAHDSLRSHNIRSDNQAAASANQMAMAAPPPAAAAAVQGPKIVQTAFIHKLYNMLEDPAIGHLITWSQNEESFVMAPNNEFSKVLAQYFKHTNISSFVRQLNMYGFHKVSDVFHNGSPEHPLWEFKHGANNFKRGDLVGLREIKRRASRHNLVHTSQKPPQSQPPGAPAEPMPPMMDGSDPRIASLERTVTELMYRLDRSESGAQYVNLKHNALTDSVNRLLHFQQELTRMLMALVPNQETQQHKDAYQLSCEISRQLEIMRGVEEPHEPAYFDRRPYFGGLDNAPVSPRHYTQDEARRSSLAVTQSRAPYDHRPQVPSGLSQNLSQNLSISTKRGYGSIGGNSVATQANSSTTQSSPSNLRPGPPPTPGPHPLAAMEHPSMARRHTSADIRVHESWRPQQLPPFSSGPPSSHLPSSPSHLAPPDERLRESLSCYAFPPTQSPRHSRPPSPQPPQPPMFSTGDTFKQLNNFQWDRSERRSIFQPQDLSAPATRRGSMAHILNNDDDNDARGGEDDRKRQRVM